ncbi:MAG: hypothetical protein GY847_17180 [Proteobacteria bacterium]|nr:hypothetical protein [Pseudomonadota bacterium]
MYEDKTLVCLECKKEFNFTVGEQEFFEQKGFTSDPKRCKDCRTARRRKKSRSDGIYRSPAFEGSAPNHQKIRGRQTGVQANQGEYRSPAFREQDHIKPEQEYRSPGFREDDAIIPEEEYRSPGFQEYEDIDLKEEYRSPGFQDLKEKYTDEKPMFSITCTECGNQAMVPFLPEEKEDRLCQECFSAKRNT